jgi:hypothetical protein
MLFRSRSAMSCRFGATMTVGAGVVSRISTMTFGGTR